MYLQTTLNSAHGALVCTTVPLIRMICIKLVEALTFLIGMVFLLLTKLGNLK